VGQRLGKSQVLFREVQKSMIERILYVAFDQLNLKHGVLAKANKEKDLIVFVESQRMTESELWHKERLFFLISSARHFAKALQDSGFQVSYIKSKTTVDGLKSLKLDLPIFCAEPSSFKQTALLSKHGVKFTPNDFFLTPRPLFFDWATKQKSFVMENFYRLQRQRLGILVTDNKPEGGQWNFDKDNRLGPPKNYEFPEPLSFQRDEIDLEVAKELNMQPSSTWATTRADALTALKHFVSKNLAGFGPYEDASTNQSWTLHHSLLSPYLNNGLLQASEVVDAAVAAYRNGGIPIQSAEAFVRQVIGWREYINGMYWFLGEEYRELNGLNANRKLLPVFVDSKKSKMNCVSSVVADVEQRAWTHHIPRLMILSNLALITGTNPQEFLDWMRQNFIDAAEWVMVPNVIGMGVHADSGRLMTKPYAAGGAYINRMTQYCKSCVYDPKLRVGDNACPFTTLYWDFLDRNAEVFRSNHRMAQQINGIKRLSDLPELRVRAKEVLSGLDKGTI